MEKKCDSSLNKIFRFVLVFISVLLLAIQLPRTECLRMQHLERVKTGWLRIRKMCPRTVVSVGNYYNNIQLSVLVEYKADLIVISLKINLFSP